MHTEPQVNRINQVHMASRVFASLQSESLQLPLHVRVCVCKPLIMRTQLWIRKVNKVTGLN